MRPPPAVADGSAPVAGTPYSGFRRFQGRHTHNQSQGNNQYGAARFLDLSMISLD